MKTRNIVALTIILFLGLGVTAQKKKKNKRTKILIETTLGDITVELYNETEYHKNNFIKLVKDKYYDGILFHRVIKDFMVQTGDPESKTANSEKTLGSGGPGYTLPAEIVPKYYHKKGALSAARTGDGGNPTRRSSGSQFYLVTGKKYTNVELDKLEARLKTKITKEQRKIYTSIGGTPFLDAQYTVFGEIIEGLDVIDKIQIVKTKKGDRPIKDVKIMKMKIL